ncbi:MAG: hypothetical protein JO235_14085 [Chroococcidiopsidaceae cyanobacterium CP_BM_RX_35]|nr:hypothetical protein [Chroococcidiopsidaceae cyanobacterium CP_BM_RX_35]
MQQISDQQLFAKLQVVGASVGDNGSCELMLFRVEVVSNRSKSRDKSLFGQLEKLLNVEMI